MLMPYIYHIVSKDFEQSKIEGEALYPLNVLKEKYPKLYSLHAQKYENKKHIQEFYIPQLSCYWGDVVHFSAVRPEAIVQLLDSCGLKKEFSYYEIDVTSIDLTKTIVYTNKPRENMKLMTEDDFVPFRADEITRWAEIPQATIDYYQKCMGGGREPTLFLYIPHILYQGIVSLAGFKLRETTSLIK